MGEGLGVLPNSELYRWGGWGGGGVGGGGGCVCVCVGVCVCVTVRTLGNVIIHRDMR